MIWAKKNQANQTVMISPPSNQAAMAMLEESYAKERVVREKVVGNAEPVSTYLLLEGFKCVLKNFSAEEKYLNLSR